jgi:transposase-like protein
MTVTDTILARIEQGATYAEIGREVGRSRQWVSEVARRAGVSRTVPLPDELDNRLSDAQAKVREAEDELSKVRAERLAAVRDALDAGVSGYRVAAALGVKQSTLAYIVQTGEKNPPKKS